MTTCRSHKSAAARMVATMLVTALCVLSASAAPSGDAGPVEATLDQLSEILQHIEGQLSALEAPRIERLEEGIEQLIELIESLLIEFDRPRSSATETSIKGRILRLDKALHQLVDVLERIVEGNEPEQPKMTDAIDELRRWVDGYVAGLTAGLSPTAAERLEATVHKMIRDLALRIAEMVEHARADEPEYPRLEAQLGRLQSLVHRLDAWIRQRFSVLPDRTP